MIMALSQFRIAVGDENVDIRESHAVGGGLGESVAVESGTCGVGDNYLRRVARDTTASINSPPLPRSSDVLALKSTRHPSRSAASPEP